MLARKELNPARNPGESQSAYRDRRKANADALKSRRDDPPLLWDSWVQGAAFRMPSGQYRSFSAVKAAEIRRSRA